MFNANYVPLEQEINVLHLHFRDVFPTTGPRGPLVTLPDSIVIAVTDPAFTLGMLVKYWQPEWGLSFVKYHPEQCGLGFCESNSAYLQWDQRVQKIYTRASDIPFIKSGASYQNGTPAWLEAIDPFFAAGAPGNRFAAQFINELNNYSVNVLGLNDTRLAVKGLTKYVDYQLYCADTTAGIQTNTAAHTLAADAWNACSPAASCRIPDREWGLYAQLYFQLKLRYYNQLRNDNCGGMCTVGTAPAILGTNCPTSLNFSIEASSRADSAGYRFARLVALRGAVGHDLTVALNYPPEYRFLTAVTKVDFTADKDAVEFYYNASISKDLISVGWVDCYCDNPATIQFQSWLGPGQYYDAGSYYGIDAPPAGCTNVTLVPVNGCLKVYAKNNLTPEIYRNVSDLWKCVACSSSLVSYRLIVNQQDSDTSFFSQDSLYVIRPNSGKRSIYPDPTFCGIPPRYYDCLSVNMNGTIFYFAHAFVWACKKVGHSMSLKQNEVSDAAVATQPAGGVIASIAPPSAPLCNYGGDFTLVPLHPGHPVNDTFYIQYQPGAHPVALGTTVTVQVSYATYSSATGTYTPLNVFRIYPDDFNTYSGRSTVYLKVNNPGSGNPAEFNNSITAVSCTTVPGCSALYMSKASRLDDYTQPGIFVTNKDSMRDVTLDAIASQVHANCENTADAWMALLDSCLTTSLGTAYTAKRATLRATLVAICSQGGDSSHVYGSSTTAPGLTGAGGFTTFKDAIKGILGISAYQLLCNPWLLDNPYPYSTPMQAGMPQIGATNAAVCARIAALQSDYAAASPKPATFFDYLRTRYVANMTLTSAQVSSLVNSCTNCRYLLDQVITLPVFMDPNNVGCLNITQFRAGLTAFAAEGWTGLDTTKPIYSTVLTNYLNQRWGFTLGESSYAAFKQAMYATPNSTTLLLCNQPVYASIPQDPLECAKGLIDNAVFEGLRQYDAYIDTVKQHFRTRYVTTCSAAQVQADMRVKEQVYHYTLYYYDQAGNLVRTVPPEGVDILDGARLAQVQQARNQPASCNYNGPAANTDVNTALAQLNTALTGAGKSIEMWLYNPDNTTSQLITATGSNQFLMVTCLDGRYMHLDLYPMSQSAATELLMNPTSAHIAVDMNAVLPLKQWTHLVLQGSNIASGAMSVYVNGISCPLVTNAPDGTCGFELTAQTSTVQVTQDLSMLKQMRFYNRVMTAAEILADAQDPCLGVTGSLVAGLQLWSRFNTPAANTATTLANGSTTETQYSQVLPLHRLASNDAFNSMAQTTQQQTPDGGISKFWYDKLGRIVASQNAQQASLGNVYSYTFYDALSRIREVGQKTGVSLALPAPDFLPDATNNAFAASGNREQITTTFYDQPYTGALVLGGTQSNLRKRVAYSKYSALPATTDDQSAITFYTYDLLGNVSTLWQQLPGLGLRQTDYQFDLASGKVNKVRYQFGKPDQFYYQYDYDAENRLTDVSSSVSNLSATAPWELLNAKQDAHYQYYYHGPLGRELIGGSRGLQGIDYAYTLQGWLKGVNGNTANGSQDMGRDGISGSPSSTIARDAIAYSLNYFDTDFKPVSPAATALGLSYQHQGNDVGGQALFNGNISSSTLSYSNLSSGAPVGYTYHYDQLNRLLHMQQHVLSGSGTTWSAAQAIRAYEEQIRYDGNGNITFFNRNGSHATAANVVETQADMDRLSYVYPKNSNGQLTSNRLRHILDGVPGSNYGNKDLSGQPADNYHYDHIGNLTADPANGVSDIQWTVYGKMSQLTKTGSGGTLKYRYDAGGNRIYKEYISGGITSRTWYARDAQGNILAVYGNKNGDNQVYWQEQDLYGSRRLGTWQPGLALTAGAGATAWSQEGLSRYELTNHLGNVLSTISDQRLGVDNDHNGTVDYYLPMITSYSDYTPFGMQMVDRNGSTGGYRYGFNGKESDNEIKGDGNQQDYGMRVYDPRVGRFLSVDPLTGKYPELTPYQFASNMPIWAMDLDGLEAFRVTQRSFAPWARFGDAFGTFKKSFMGDDRGFSLYESSTRPEVLKATARLHSMASFTLGTDGISAGGHFSSVTTGYRNFIGSSEERGFARPSGIEEFKNNKLTLQVEGSDPLVSVAPDIDWRTDLNFTMVGQTVLQVSGDVKGKAFPAYESFIEDNVGNKVFLHTYAAPDRLELGKELLNPLYDYKRSISFRFELDPKGNFTGKMWRPNGENKWSETTISDWNRINLNKKPAPDLEPGEGVR